MFVKIANFHFQLMNAFYAKCNVLFTENMKSFTEMGHAIILSTSTGTIEHKLCLNVSKNE